MHKMEIANEVIKAVAATASQEIPNWFVVVMGVGTVFVGLICIIILCKIVALLCSIKKNTESKEEAPMPTVEVPVQTVEAPIENRQEIIAAVAAVCAEELGTDVSAIRIHSFRKI